MPLAPPQSTPVLGRGGIVSPEWQRYFTSLRGGKKPRPSGTVFDYRADTTATTASDPGAGYLRWNTADQAAASAIYFDWLTVDGLDVHLFFQLMTSPARFLIQDADLAVNYQLWALTGPAVNHPDWFEVPVTLITSGGSAFSNNQRLAVWR